MKLLTQKDDNSGRNCKMIITLYFKINKENNLNGCDCVHFINQTISKCLQLRNFESLKWEWGKLDSYMHAHTNSHNKNHSRNKTVKFILVTKNLEWLPFNKTWTY